MLNQDEQLGLKAQHQRQQLLLCDYCPAGHIFSWIFNCLKVPLKTCPSICWWRLAKQIAIHVLKISALKHFLFCWATFSFMHWPRDADTWNSLWCSVYSTPAGRNPHSMDAFFSPSRSWRIATCKSAAGNPLMVLCISTFHPSFQSHMGCKEQRAEDLGVNVYNPCVIWEIFRKSNLGYHLCECCENLAYIW